MLGCYPGRALIPRLGTSRLVIAGMLAASCGGRGSAPAARPPDVDAPELGASYASPATWRYHPSERARINAREELAKGRALLVGARGERWVYDAGNKTLQAAASLAPEDLVAVLRSPEQGYWFIGRSGTNYEAREPLGPFVRSSAPFDRLAEVSAAKGTLLGVRFDRRLVRSTDGGASWSTTGPEDANLVDVEMTSDGHALLLGLPERLWESADAGATFKPVAARPEGRALARTRSHVGGSEGGHPARRGTLPAGRSLSSRSGRSGIEGAAARDRHPAAGAPTPAPSPRGGRCCAEPSTWRRSRRTNGTTSGDSGAGKLDGALEKSDLDEAKGCRAHPPRSFRSLHDLRLLSRERRRTTTQPVELYRSAAPGQKFERESFTPLGSLASFQARARRRGKPDRERRLHGVGHLGGLRAERRALSPSCRAPARRRRTTKGKLPELAKAC